MELRKHRIAIAVLLVMVVAACGGDGGTTTTAAPGGSTTVADGGTTVAGGGTTVPGGDTTVPGGTDLQSAASHDEILAQCEAEGHVDIHTGLSFEPFVEAFEAEYPFVQVDWYDMSGEAPDRFLLELEAGQAGGIDVATPPVDDYATIADLTSWDLYGMVEDGILDIPIESIDAARRTVAIMASGGVAFVYNKDLVSEEDLPQTYDDLADPMWSRDNLGIVLDVDPKNVAALVPALGEEKVMEIAASMAAQDPVWGDGNTATSLLVQSGEVAATPFTNAHSAQRIIEEDPSSPLGIHWIEPVPIRNDEAFGIFNDEIADEPYCGLLFIEWMAGDTAQGLLDADPWQALIYTENSLLAEQIGDKELSVVSFEEFESMDDWIGQINEVFGFPTPEVTEE